MASSGCLALPASVPRQARVAGVQRQCCAPRASYTAARRVSGAVRTDASAGARRDSSAAGAAASAAGGDSALLARRALLAAAPALLLASAVAPSLAEEVAEPEFTITAPAGARTAGVRALL
jgi:hypothetical protein